MTRLIIETDDKWTREKIRFAIDTEIYLLKKTFDKIQEKIKSFESKYGELNRENFFTPFKYQRFNPIINKLKGCEHSGRTEPCYYRPLFDFF